MAFIIIVKMYSNRAQVIVDSNDEPAIFLTIDKAENLMSDHPLNIFDYWVLNLDTGETYS